jgi:Short C-terminal domain
LIAAAGGAVHAVTSRKRLIAARTLTVLAVVLTVVSVLANFVTRSVLDTSWFRGTSRAVIANPTVRNQVGLTLVDQLYANVDVSGVLRKRLPKNLQGLAGPISGAVRSAADTSARQLLQRPAVQAAFVTAATTAQRQLVVVLDGGNGVLQTSGGVVVLDLRPLVLDLGNQFGLPDLSSRIPPTAAQITVLRSNQLKTAQRLTRLLRVVADWIWVLALAAAAGAVWLAHPRRRLEVRALAIGLLVVGFLILVVQSLVGRYLVDHLVTTDSVRPAAAAVYTIVTVVLRGDGWTAIIIALVALAGIWLAGPRPRAVAARRLLCPYLRRPGIAYGSLVVAYLLLLWWRPTPQFGFPVTALVWFALAVLGLETLRRQTVRQFPDVEASHPVAAVRAHLPRRAGAAGAGQGTADQLERLARLHTQGLLDDAEFAAAKAQVLGAGAPAGVP